MGKLIRGVLQVAAIAVQFIPGIGQIAAAAITIGLGLLNAALAPKSPKIPSAQRDRLFATIDPSTPRKIVLGRTAMATDIRYEEWGGSEQEYLDRIIGAASHKVQSIDEIWIEDKLAWTSAGGVQGSYVGYLTVATRLEGTAANTIAINGGAKWGANRRLTGCAYVHMRFKTTGNSKKAESPFASSIPQRLTIIGRGALLYDPRKDSTVGGSGAQRADDQSTWAWVSEEVGNNTALQELWYLLGWRINGKLAVGRGIPPRRIDMASFIASANLCDETVALAAGGTEKRYRSAGVVSEADTATSVLEALNAACDGTLRDAGGKLALTVLHNDLAFPAADFTDDDILGEFDWQQTLGLDQSFNEVRGRFTDPSPNALYQLVDYPAIRPFASPDGLDRVHPFDLAMVQSGSQAQRLAKQEFQRAQYQGVFSAEFKATAWKAQVGDVVRLTFSTLGFVNKLFRVTEQVIRMDGTCPMVLREEHASIYAWTAEDQAVIQPVAPTVYDPLNSPLITGIDQANRYIDGTPIDDLRPAELGATNRHTFLRSVLPSNAEAKEEDYLSWAPEGGRLKRHGGLGMTLNGEEMLFSGETMNLPWVDVQDAAIPAAQLAADVANDNALEAQQTADAANASAGQALDAIAVIGADGWLTKNEKGKSGGLIDRNNQLEIAWAILDAQAAAFGITTERTAAAAARTAWQTYRNGLAPAWSDTAQDTVVDRTTFRTKLSDLDQALDALQRAITDKAAQTADWDQVTGAGKTVVVTAAANFNLRNDRNGGAITAPTIPGGGAAIDHAVNTDGSVDISFEWSWGGSEPDIDGWLVYLRSSNSSTPYVFGTSPVDETVYVLPPDKRAFILSAAAGDRYYTFGIRAYRLVDPDIVAGGRVLSTLVQSAVAGENPYQPVVNVAFAGNVTGTVGGAAAASVASGSAAANNGLNGDGSVKPGKVVSTSLSADVVTKIVSASNTNVTASDAGVLLLTLAGVAAKPSQGGYVHMILSCHLAMDIGNDFARDRVIFYGRLQRSPAGAGTWTELFSWPLCSMTLDNGLSGSLELDDFRMSMSAGTQYIDVPPGDGSFDYRWLASKTSDGTGSTPPETGPATASNAYGVALSVKVAT